MFVTAAIIHRAVAVLVNPGVQEVGLEDAVQNAMTVRVRGPQSLFLLAGAIGELLGPGWYRNSSNVPRITAVPGRLTSDRSAYVFWPGIAWEPAPVDDDPPAPECTSC